MAVEAARMVDHLDRRTAYWPFGDPGVVKATWREITCHIMAICIGMAVIFPAGFMLMDRGSVVTLTNLRIEPNTVEVGGRVTIKWTTVEHRKGCGGFAEQQIISAVNKQVYYFVQEPVVYHEASSSEPVTFTRELITPSSISPGPAIYRSHVTRWCNVLQEFIWPMHDNVQETPFVFVKPGAAL